MNGDSWFTLEQLDDSTYAISEEGHWEHTHQYLFLGRDRAALVDSGLGIASIRALTDTLTGLPTIVLTTHAHWDHIGGHGLFMEKAVHEADAGWLEHGLPISLTQARRNFLSRPLTKVPPEGFNIEHWVPYTGRPSHLLRDGDVIDLGGRRLTVLHTPGHAPGHCCFYEETTGYLVTGDLLYEGRLDAFYESTDPAQFRRSIARLVTLPRLTKLLPGHHRLHIPTSYLWEAQQAFDALAARGQLHHGSGLHRFAHFSVYV